MEFTWPGLLLLLLATPLLVAAYVWALRRRARFAVRYSSLTIVRDALGKGPGIRRHVPPFFFLLGLTTMLIGLARPVGLVSVPAEQATVILAIDVSRSMRANDIQPTRIEAAKQAALRFVEGQKPSTRIGVVSFSATADLVQAPTTDRDAVMAAIDRLTLGSRTAIGSAILASLDAIFEDPNISEAPPSEPVLVTPTPVPEGFHVPAVVILLTDGRSNTGPLPLQSAQTATNLGVRVFTVGIGTAQGAVIQGGGGRPSFGGGFGGGSGNFGFRADLDENTLKEIATITDAKYFHASETEELLSIYQNLNTQLIVQTQRTELTAWFTGAATFFLLIGGMLSLLWFNRLP